MTPNNQKGQASIFVLAFIGVILVCTIFLYQSGRITTEKMQLQNAADAAAFSASTLEARSLNFCAYTNRAMVANEVGIGQMIGLLSLIDEVKTIGSNFQDFAEAVTASCLAIPLVGEAILAAVSPFIDPLEVIGTILNETGIAMEDVMAEIAAPIIRALSIVNEVYSFSQTAYHGATIFMVTTTLFKTIEDNVPGTSPFKMKDIFNQDRPGAHLSDLGILALAGHIPTYWHGYTKRYKPGKIKENEGMQRLAATIRTARDPFSKDWDGADPPSNVTDDLCKDSTFKTRNWHLCLDLKFEVSKSITIASIDIWAEFDTGFGSQGASELRYKDTNYNWSAIDTAAFGVDLSWGYKATFLTYTDEDSFDIGIEIPVGGSGYQAASEVRLTLSDMPNDLRNTTSIPGAYGLKSKSFLSWEQAALEMEENNIETYSGLAPYRGMGTTEEKEPAYTIPFMSPFYLVGVVRKVSDINKTGPKFSGNLNILEENPQITEIGAIAKSEVYYKRPSDLSYFLRGDEDNEKANVFGPFWQARLAKTNNIDRFLALAIQHKTIWLAKHDAEEVPGLESLEKGFMTLLDIF